MVLSACLLLMTFELSEKVREVAGAGHTGSWGVQLRFPAVRTLIVQHIASQGSRLTFEAPRQRSGGHPRLSRAPARHRSATGCTRCRGLYSAHSSSSGRSRWANVPESRPRPFALPHATLPNG